VISELAGQGWGEGGIGLFVGGELAGVSCSGVTLMELCGDNLVTFVLWCQADMV